METTFTPTAGEAAGATRLLGLTRRTNAPITFPHGQKHRVLAEVTDSEQHLVAKPFDRFHGYLHCRHARDGDRS